MTTNYERPLTVKEAVEITGTGTDWKWSALRVKLQRRLKAIEQSVTHAYDIRSTPETIQRIIDEAAGIQRALNLMEQLDRSEKLGIGINDTPMERA